MNTQALLLAAGLQTRLGAALRATAQAQMAGDAKGEIAADLEVAAAAEAIIDAMVPLGSAAPLDIASHARFCHPAPFPWQPII